MSLKSLAAAVAVVVGIGQAADAVTIESGQYSVTITLEDYGFNCIQSGACDDTPKPGGSSYALLALGETVQGVLDLQFMKDDFMDISAVFFVFSYPAGQISSEYYWDSVGENSFVDYISEDGFTFEMTDGRLSGRLFAVYDRPDSWSEYADIRFTEIAPVPLPASAALLPLGIGALAVMRRRRRLA